MPVATETEVKVDAGPDWLETPDECSYSLIMFDSYGEGGHEVDVSREEFIALKERLVELRLAEPKVRVGKGTWDDFDGYLRLMRKQLKDAGISAQAYFRNILRRLEDASDVQLLFLSDALARWDGLRKTPDSSDVQHLADIAQAFQEKIDYLPAAARQLLEAQQRELKEYLRKGSLAGKPKKRTRKGRDKVA